MNIEAAVAALTADGKWSVEQVHLGFRAGFHCEYCDRDLLASVDDYDAWQVDHLVPQSRGGDQSFDNKAISCKTCNFLKRVWDPRLTPELSRPELIAVVRQHIAARRATKQAEIDRVRALVRG